MKDKLKAPFRASFICVVGDVSTEEETTKGKNMISFTLMDDLGAWIPCIAMDDHVKSETLAGNNKVFIYNGRVRVGAGSFRSKLSLLSEASMVPLGTVLLPGVKRTAVQL